MIIELYLSMSGGEAQTARPGAFGTCLQHLGNSGGNEHMVKDVYMRRGT